MQYNFGKPTQNEDHKNIDLFMALVLQSRGQFVFPLSQDTNIVRFLYFPLQKVQIISINNLFLVAAAAADFAFFPLLCIPSDSSTSPPLPNMTGELFLQKNIPEEVIESPIVLTHSQIISNMFQNRS